MKSFWIFFYVSLQLSSKGPSTSIGVQTGEVKAQAWAQALRSLGVRLNPTQSNYKLVSN